MTRILLFAAASVFVAAASTQASASELKSQPRSLKSIQSDDAAISGCSQGAPRQTVATASPSGGKKPKEIVVVGSKTKQQSTGSVGANRTETIGASQTTSTKPKGAGSPSAASKQKGEIEIQSFGWPQPRSK